MATLTHKNFIGGKWVAAASGETYERRNPFDQSLVASYQDSDEHDVALAVDAAREAFDHGPWPRMSAFDRAAVLRRAAALVRQRKDSLADTMTREVGQPRVEMLKGVASAADALDFYAGLVTERRDEAIAGQRQDAIGMVLKEPVGAVGSLTAWNAPLSLTHKACPGLAAGCVVVTKPAHQSSGAVIELARIFEEAGLPPGALNVVTSARENGAIVGQAIAASDRLDMVTFTGSSATGKAVMRAAANNLKRVKLELGGKSPNIVFADAQSLDHTAAAVAKGIFRLAGQSCQAGSRLLVQESVKDEFMELLLKHVAAVKLGDPFHADTICGPLVSQDQLQRVSAFVERGTSEARLVCGGKRPDREDLRQGFFLEPTVFDQVAPNARIAQEEAFGPVLSVLTFKDEEDAIRIANGTIFGLVAGCWTTKLDTAMRVARALRSGIVWVNCYRDDAPLKYMPTGFRKQSGIGSEMGPEGLEAFLDTKSVMIRLSA
ncbi:MAG TPA: aldehyde dehydrogenase family protein [Ramlibacter sp.]|nr:aldehyde dehydrogenase family protein [Ramlibacter sp.]